MKTKSNEIESVISAVLQDFAFFSSYDVGGQQSFLRWLNMMTDVEKNKGVKMGIPCISEPNCIFIATPIIVAPWGGPWVDFVKVNTLLQSTHH